MVTFSAGGGGNDDNNEFNAQFFQDPQQFDSSASDLETSLQLYVKDYVPLDPPESTRPKRKIKRIEFLEDDAHWEKPGDGSRKGNIFVFFRNRYEFCYVLVRKKKTVVREQEQDDEEFLFSPRDTFKHVTLSRERNRVPIAIPTPRIQRCQDFSCPKTIEEPFSYRLDDQISMIVPGFAVS